jgi:uncharacterized protein (TIGR00255 family)
MINGMTGFGTAQVSWGKIKGVLEVKSQNHRYFDTVFYLPVGFSSVENKIRKKIAQIIKRGRVTVSFKITEKPIQHLSLNKDAVEEYIKYARILKKQYGMDNDMTLSDLIKLPGVFSAKEQQVHVDKIWPELEKGLLRATKSLADMRKREGKSLQLNMVDILKRMKKQIQKIKVRASFLLREKKKRSSQEDFLSFQKGFDINEEIIRLIHYIDEFKLHLKTSVSVGKKLDFVAQEMQRETNTIGSKVQDKEVANAVVALKSKIEKLREQAQNIE